MSHVATRNLAASNPARARKILKDVAQECHRESMFLENWKIKLKT